MNIHVSNHLPPNRRVRFLGLDYDALEQSNVLALLLARNPKEKFAAIVTPNADHLVRISNSETIAGAYRSASMRLNDSRIVSALAKLRRIPLTTVPGSDLLSSLFHAPHFDAGWPILVVGGSPEMFSLLVKQFGLTGAMHYDAPMGLLTDPTKMAMTVAHIETHPARFVLLAVGSPQQELIAQAVAERGNATGIGLCIGAAVEFLVHPERRAPRWMSRWGLEWLYRLASEPKRLWRRYLVDSPKLFSLALKDWAASRSAGK
jgi:exopolysaccharide biosynthesis WecB/TagA/CpsF family protein